MTQTDPLPPTPGASRQVRRILAEAVVVALAGGLVLGVMWEIHLWNLGWVLAGIIWVTGGPILEILRVIEQRRG